MTAGIGVGTENAFGIGTVSRFLVLGGENFQTFVQVGGVSCSTFDVSTSDKVCGSMTLTSPQVLPPPADWPADVNYSATASFTAAGHLDVGPGFDFVGRGTLEVLECRDFSMSLCFFTDRRLLYTFTVPEPPTLLLLVGAGLVGLVGLGCARTLRRV
jgi:hypothetical protein